MVANYQLKRFPWTSSSHKPRGSSKQQVASTPPSHEQRPQRQAVGTEITNSTHYATAIAVYWRQKIEPSNSARLLLSLGLLLCWLLPPVRDKNMDPGQQIAYI